ncbi:MAG: amidohydrolase family protein, partial [Anaerolineales bacterium]
MMQSSATMAQPTGELVIHNGLIISDSGRTAAEIRIRGGKIVEIAPKIAAAPGAHEIDATGMYLMPGVIDTHTHLPMEPVNPPNPKGNSDDLISGSKAALAGGVTLLGDFVGFAKDEDANAFADRVTAAIQRQAIADVYIKASITPLEVPAGCPNSDPNGGTYTGPKPNPSDCIPDRLTQQKTFDALAARGIVSTGENFMARPSYDKNSFAWAQTFFVSGKAGVVSMIHPEDASIMSLEQERLITEPSGAGNNLHNFELGAPVAAEVAAVQRSLAIAEVTQSPIVLLHVTAGRSVMAIEEAKRRGLTVYLETRPWNLFGTWDRYKEQYPGLWVGGPPLRSKWDQDMLWDGIHRRVVDTIGSDHTAYTKAAKMDPNQTITDKRMGQETLQDYPAMMFSYGINGGHITPEDFVAVTSTNAAKILGMYPRKGVIAVGSDADIVIWDPKKKKTLTDASEFSNAKYAVYEGLVVTGVPITTIRRGEIVYDNGKILAQPGSGRFIPGAKFRKPTLRPLIACGRICAQ